MLQDFGLHRRPPGRLTIAGAPEGYDARVLAAMADEAGTAGLFHLTTDQERVERLEAGLAFFAPGLERLVLPEWDCLPYDRVSPSGMVTGRRIATLIRLIERAKETAPAPLLVLTTAAAFLRRLPPREALSGAGFRAAVGRPLDLDRLRGYLLCNGYSPAAAVREPGDFALRQDGADLFPPGAPQPLRLDLAADGTLAAVRGFDPLTQRSTGEERERIALKPMAEVLLDHDSIARFRSFYRELFGVPVPEQPDPLYEAVSAGRRHAGMEHWLPLFHGTTETLGDYLPDAAVSLDAGAEEARDERLARIRDAYEARRSLRTLEARARLPAYKPVPPELAFLDEAGWERCITGRAVRVLAAEPPAEVPGDAVVDAGARPIEDGEESTTAAALRAGIERLRSDGYRLLIAAGDADRQHRLLRGMQRHGIEPAAAAADWTEVERLDPGTIAVVPLALETGFAAPELAVLARSGEMAGRAPGAAARHPSQEQVAPELEGLTQGELVIHAEHGLGVFDGIETVEAAGVPRDCLRLLYEDGDKLYVPVESADLVTRYGAATEAAQLDRLGGTAWQTRKERAQERIRAIAAELVKTAAARELKRTEPITVPPQPYRRFAAGFPYTETPDQRRAIAEVLADLRSGRLMDRLVCGDVGFGKTEVALRAAFAVAWSGRQVAVVAPTTPLCRQHYEEFRARFAPFRMTVAQLSRAVPPKQAKEVKEGIRNGAVRIAIGTHALLSESVVFRDLGLLIIDEEQRLGVKQKERLKQRAENVHVLTMTATPIPRTLQLALHGFRDLSLITTPPVARQPVRTYALPYDPVVVRAAMQRERARGGQVFYVCPRLEDLDGVRERLAELLPDASVITAHGKMPAAELDDAMVAFAEGDADVLLATNIVESGLNFPNANTLIVHRSNLFGLAQLHQLRGRVGRSAVRGHAYFTWEAEEELSPTARKRMEALAELDSLGAGFTIATQDLELRGGGNILGEEQSGFVRDVGIDLLQRMLREAVEAIRRGEAPAEPWTPRINVGLPVLIPADYVPNQTVRVSLYSRIANLQSPVEADALADELADRFGPLPPPVETLLAIGELKRLCRQAQVEQLDIGPKGALLTLHNANGRGSPGRNGAAGGPDGIPAPPVLERCGLQRRPDGKLVFRTDGENEPGLDEIAKLIVLLRSATCSFKTI